MYRNLRKKMDLRGEISERAILRKNRNILRRHETSKKVREMWKKRGDWNPELEEHYQKDKKKFDDMIKNNGGKPYLEYLLEGYVK